MVVNCLSQAVTVSMMNCCYPMAIAVFFFNEKTNDYASLSTIFFQDYKIFILQPDLYQFMKSVKITHTNKLSTYLVLNATIVEGNGTKFLLLSHSFAQNSLKFHTWNKKE